jgi:D-aminoacyl-tRNA deacylase
MNYAILYSKKDEAGMNIAEQLKKFFMPQVPILEMKKDSIHEENIDEKEEYKEQLKNADLIIFATKHQSKENRNTLSLHAPGNWRNADYGGKPGKICKTSALALKFLAQKMQENIQKENLNYELTLECTHHGPLINKPCLFIEIGTTIEQWQNKKAASVIAKTLSDFQEFDKWKSEYKSKLKVAVCVGSPHYSPNFTKIQLSQESNIAISHIIPEYQLPLTESMLKEAIEKTQENVDLILMDWKGCGNSASRLQIIQIIEKLGMPHDRTERINK